jgi:cellulose biosynthesis protein BcsQ
MIITIANQKGGVSKTTLAVHLATWLCRQGKRVVLVDLDAQGNVAPFLGLERTDDLAELFQAVLTLRPDRRPPLKSFLTAVPGYEDLVVVRGWQRSTALEVALQQPGAKTATDALQDVLRPLLAIPRLHVVFDTGPYAGVLQQAAISLADHVLVPAIPERASEAGMLDIARRLAEVGRRITGVIPTRFNAVTREHQNTIKVWQDTLGPVVYYNRREGLVGLPNRIIWGELPRYGRPIWDVAPRDEAAREMDLVSRKVAYDAEI